MADDPAPDELFATDAYRRSAESRVLDVDGSRVALARTVFYPGGGGQPADRGVLTWDDADGGTGRAAVVGVGRRDGRILHELDVEPDAMPPPGTEVHAELDWDRRYALMRTHTALHVLCGVIWSDFGVAVTGGNMNPGDGRLDFALDAVTSELGERVQRRINEEIARARAIAVEFVDRSEADLDDALIRTKANLIPASIDPLRVIDIVGLDRQADGGTHVASTVEVGRVEVTKTENKGRDNKRIRIAIHES
ncbi:alanyl-tRNA editing protein [Salsipaludibacter albus]|uniref:alanyl-tRNA editing protein n=1 Tax=Salsipaludibacter albus TaxID=2849650 RepID=UPI001EE40D5A|nr:alanyl-tRNA editing protein [Salsipaludibacter albus]